MLFIPNFFTFHATMQNLVGFLAKQWHHSPPKTPEGLVMTAISQTVAMLTTPTVQNQYRTDPDHLEDLQDDATPFGFTVGLRWDKEPATILCKPGVLFPSNIPRNGTLSRPVLLLTPLAHKRP